MTQYWFARYQLKPRPSRALLPISWQGRAVIAGFVAGMALGGVAFLVLALVWEQFVAGAAIFVVMAIASAGVFIWATATRADPVRTAHDYLAERAKP